MGGEQGGANYSGTFIKDYLESNNREVLYLTSEKLPFPLAELDARLFIIWKFWG